MDTVYLIGGAPTVGKSTTTACLAKQLGIPYMGTDQIRFWLRTVVQPADYPHLFSKTQTTAVAFLENRTAEAVAENEWKESLEVQRGIDGFIQTERFWGSYIIEGVNILPAYAAHLQATFKQNSAAKPTRVCPVFLINTNVEAMQHIVQTRGVWSKVQPYPQHVRGIELAWVQQFQAFIVGEAEKHNVPIIDVANTAQYPNPEAVAGAIASMAGT